MGKRVAELTDGELRAAFERHRLPSWPATFEAAFADPLTRRQIQIFAAHFPTIRPKSLDLIRAGIIPRETPQAPRPLPPPPPAPLFLDQKSRAAGEREDPED